MFTLIVTVLAVLAVLGFLVRIADSVHTASGAISPRNSPSDGRKAAHTHRPTADLRGVR
jgi:hypothetical protein